MIGSMPDFTLDFDRMRRVGFPEVVLAQGKSLEPSILITAMSESWSVAITRAVYSFPSWTLTLIFDAPSTTWLFVMMYPLGSTITPEPRLLRVNWSGRSGVPKGRRLNSSCSGSRSRGFCCCCGGYCCCCPRRLLHPRVTFTTSSVLILTTAGPTLAAI